MRSILLAALALLLGAAPAAATTRYVSTTGSDSNACTISAKCLTFNRGYQVASPGDTVEVSAGTTYGDQRIDPDSSKTSSSDVVIQPASGATVVIGTLNSGRGEIDDEGASHITVKNMTVDGINWSLADDVLLDNLTSTGGGYYYGVTNLVRRNGSTTLGADEPGEHIRPNRGTTHALVIPDNVTISHVTYTGAAPNPSTPDPHITCIDVQSSKHVNILRNRFSGCYGEALKISTNVASEPIENVVVYDNSFISCPSGQFAYQIWDATNLSFRYNSQSSSCASFAMNRKDNTSCQLYGENCDWITGTVVISNNALADPDSNFCSGLNASATPTYRNNYLMGSSTKCHSSDILGSYAAVNWSSTLVPQTGSPLLNAGTAAYTVPDDRDFVARSSTAPDIGAVEVP